MHRRLPFLFLLLIPSWIIAQNCKINTASNKVCLGNTLLFTVSYDPGLTPTSYSWNFGNAATSTQPSPVYQYPSRGKYVPTVTINFSNSPSCTVSGDTIRVVDNPKADFSVSTPLTQCFKNNNTCMVDLSTPGLDQAPLTTRLFLYGDGSFQSPAPGAGSTFCHNYATPLGGVFTLVLEVTDTNNCMSRKERKDHITIFSKIPDLSFQTNYVTQCGVTPVQFVNTSKITASQITSYSWDFGDGSTASSPWTNFTHTYTKSGQFDAKFSVIDKNGCRDTITLIKAAENYRIDSTIYFNNPRNQCYYHNGYKFYSKNTFGAQHWWAYYKVGDPVRIDTVMVSTVDTINFPDCGTYQVRMYVKLGNCFVRIDTTVTINGPKAVIETMNDAIINSIQCEVHDTTYYRTPVGDHSCYNNNGAMFRLWDFDDPFAPPCTTDTKSGLNVGVNCRFSKDSVRVKHRYYDGQDRCYFPKLMMYDASIGCADTSSASMKLTQPDAGWDSTSNPIRKGLYHRTAKPCLDQSITFFLDETLPKCGREKIWFMADSICPGAVWTPLDSSSNIFTWTYTSTCDPRGYVTVGLIIKNGKDKNGNDCYDTAWYHWMFKFFPINPMFNVTRMTTGCGPWTVRLSMVDSIQDSLKTVQISFGTTGGLRSINFGPNDSIIPSQYFTYNRQGLYKITLGITNTRGCSKSYEYYISFGFLRSFKPDRPVLCLHDSLTLIDDVSYYNSGYAYWRDTLRFKAGLEQLYWDYGDGKGFIGKGALPKYKYDRIGNYKIRMVAIDSLGCRDTFLYLPSVKVVDIKSAIKPMLPRYLCAPQILNFTDQSLYFDSSSLYNQTPYDTILYWYWDFGDKKVPSLLQHPVHDFTANGNYSVKLIATTSQGCVDSTTVPIWIDGPRPKFDIISDTIGCAPFEVKLKNTTGYPLVNWVWYFRDQNNATASTQLDTNVTHTYTKGGIYKIYLVGEDTVFNPFTMQYKTCLSVFPDSMNANAERRQVRVIDPLKARLEAPDTVCAGIPFDMVAHPDQLVPAFKWMTGDTNLVKQTLFPDTVFKHVYMHTGLFTAKMYPVMSGTVCTDTVSKDIVATNVQAAFDMDQTELPLVKFANKSVGAVRYEWDFGHPRSGSNNFSTLKDPVHSFTGDSGSFLVCLKAFNNQDCYDSVCKRTLPAEVRLILPNVFTPNNDGQNDAFDIDVVGNHTYSIVIYNRWGNKVFEGDRDGYGNDGNNWNGKNFNNGSECPEGTYYFLFKYQLVNMNAPKTVHGTVTLIRDE